MKNIVRRYDRKDALVETGYHHTTPVQCPIYLYINWKEGIVDIKMKYNACIIGPERIAIEMPNNVDARYLHDNIEGLMLAIERISECWDYGMLEEFILELRHYPEKYFDLY